MSLNLEAKDTFYQFDEWGMLIVPSDELSHRDSVGRTVLAWIAYGKPKELESGLDACIINGRKTTKHRLLRHPHYKEDASRDHWSYILIYLKLWGAGNWYNSFVKYVPFMRGLHLWMHALTGNKLAEFLYYLIYIPGARIGNFWLKFCRKAGGIKSELTNKLWIAGGNPNYGTEMLYRRTKWQKFWAWIIFQTIPAYPLHNKGWQLFVMPNSKRKERLKRILLKRVGKRNLMLRLLLGDDTVTQQEVDNFPNMTGYPTGVYMDETCRRTIRKLTDQEAAFNAYEKDLLIWLFYTLKK